MPQAYTLKTLSSSLKHSEVQKQIRKFILSNDLRPGNRLPTEAQIASRIGVSRTAVREGLRSLEALGIIEVRHGNGRYVRAFNFDAILDDLLYSLVFEARPVLEALEVRRALEVAFIERAVQTLTSDDLQELRRNVARMRERAERREAFFLDEDMAFHQILFSRLGNQVLLKVLSYFWALFRNLLDQPSLRPRSPMAIVAMHDDILVAVEARDKARARAALVAHFDEVGERYARAFERLERSERLIGCDGRPERGQTDRQGMRVDAPRRRSE
jgi:DNA-binding FadR family transcriptional regulator